MADRVILGPTAKVDINPVPGFTSAALPFKVLAGSIDDMCDPVEDITDTDTLGWGRDFASNFYTFAQINLAIQLDVTPPIPTAWLYSPYLNLFPGSTIGLRIWPEGRSGPANSEWLFWYAIVEKVVTGFKSQGSLPYGGAVILKSRGNYKRPYQVYDNSQSNNPPELVDTIPIQREKQMPDLAALQAVLDAIPSPPNGFDIPNSPGSPQDKVIQQITQLVADFRSQ